jgi:hypothetical protein
MRLFSHFHEPNYHIFLKIKFVRVLLRKKNAGRLRAIAGPCGKPSGMDMLSVRSAVDVTQERADTASYASNSSSLGDFGDRDTEEPAAKVVCSPPLLPAPGPRRAVINPSLSRTCPTFDFWSEK